MKRVLSISFRLTVPVGRWDEMAASYAPVLGTVPGLCWKIWLLDRELAEVAGVYLFEDQHSLQAYLDGPIAAQLRTAPWLRDLRVRSYDILVAETEITRGPVHLHAPA
jgi:hypothetical protein